MVIYLVNTISSKSSVGFYLRRGQSPVAIKQHSHCQIKIQATRQILYGNTIAIDLVDTIMFTLRGAFTSSKGSIMLIDLVKTLLCSKWGWGGGKFRSRSNSMYVGRSKCRRLGKYYRQIADFN